MLIASECTLIASSPRLAQSKVDCMLIAPECMLIAPLIRRC